MPIKSVKMKISKNKKMRFFLMSQGSFNPKIRFLSQKVWTVARGHTDGRTHTKVKTEGFRSFSFNLSSRIPNTFPTAQRIQDKVELLQKFSQRSTTSKKIDHPSLFFYQWHPPNIQISSPISIKTDLIQKTCKNKIKHDAELRWKPPFS